MKTYRDFDSYRALDGRCPLCGGALRRSLRFGEDGPTLMSSDCSDCGRFGATVCACAGSEIVDGASAGREATCAAA